jgi:hypothetical protein
MFCGHNAKEFDIPFGWAMIINNIAIQTSWIYLEKTLVRIWIFLELWKFGDYKHFTSFKLM